MNFELLKEFVMMVVASGLLSAIISYKVTNKKIMNDVRVQLKGFEHEKKLSSKNDLREYEITLMTAWSELIGLEDGEKISDILIVLYPELKEKTEGKPEKIRETIAMRHLQNMTIQIADEKTVNLVALFLNYIYEQDEISGDKKSKENATLFQLVLYSKILSSLKQNLTNDKVDYLAILMIKIKDFNARKNEILDASMHIDEKYCELFEKNNM